MADVTALRRGAAGMGRAFTNITDALHSVLPPAYVVVLLMMIGTNSALAEVLQTALPGSRLATVITLFVLPIVGGFSVAPLARRLDALADASSFRDVVCAAHPEHPYDACPHDTTWEH